MIPQHVMVIGFSCLGDERGSVRYQRLMQIIAGSLEAAYSLNWGAREIWGKGGGETLALL